MKSTMNHSRRQLPPVAPHKRKEREETFDFLKPSTTIIRPSSSSKLAKPNPVAHGPRATAPVKPFKAVASRPTNNILLAGYLAHEFLTKGTLFGQSYDPAHGKPIPALTTANSTGLRTMKQPMKQPSHGFVHGDKGKAIEPRFRAKLKPEPEPKPNRNNQRYIEVSELLKNGAHIPGIVNPSQLARFLDNK